MKKYATSIILFLLIHLLMSGTNAQTLFSKKVNTSLKELETCSILTSDGSAVVYAARTATLISPLSEKGMVIAKIDLEGNIIWSKNYDPGKIKWHFLPTSILEQDFGYYVTVYLQHAKGDAMVFKIDHEGNLLDMHMLHPIDDHYPVIWPACVVKRPDDALVMTGMVGAGHEHNNILWLRTNEDFTSYSVKSIPSTKDVEGIKIFVENNNKTIIAFNNGNLDDNPNDNNTAFPSLMKLDIDGNVLNTVNYKLPLASILNDCIRLADGSFIMVGTGLNQSFIMKINSSYDLVWYHYYSIPNSINSPKVFQNVTSTPDGGFLISGSVLMKTDASGYATSYRINPSSTPQRILDVFPVSPGGYIASAYVSYAVNILNITSDLATACTFNNVTITANEGVVVTDKNNAIASGNFATNYLVESAPFAVLDEGTIEDYCPPLKTSGELNSVNTTLELFPNPAADELKIILPASFINGKTTLLITNIFGQQIHKFESEGKDLITLDIDRLQTGNYLVRAIGENGSVATAHLTVQ